MKNVDIPVKTTKKTPIKAIVKPRLSSKPPKKTKKPEYSPKKVQNKKKVEKSTSVKKGVEKKVEEIETPVIFGDYIPKVGRPPKYKTVKELQLLIDAYFESCWAQKIDMFGNLMYFKENGKKTKRPVMIQIKPYTITGLALSIGTTRETLLDYQAKNQFSDTIKRAKDACQNYAEESLFVGKNPAGAIFNLKNNYGQWKDKQEVDSSVTGVTKIEMVSYQDVKTK
mgnify:CR=1 FL=1